MKLGKSQFPGIVLNKRQSEFGIFFDGGGENILFNKTNECIFKGSTTYTVMFLKFSFKAKHIPRGRKPENMLLAMFSGLKYYYFALVNKIYAELKIVFRKNNLSSPINTDCFLFL